MKSASTAIDDFYSKSASTAIDDDEINDKHNIILEFKANKIDPNRCPFINDTVSFTLNRGSCVHLAGKYCFIV